MKSKPNPTPAPTPGSHHGNFRDPWGLVLRMIRSGNRAARAALWHAGAGMLAVPLDLFLSPFERRRLERAGPISQSIVLVVGPPRSGTTLAYQILARYTDASYLNNLSAVFSRAPIVATQLFRPFVGTAPGDFLNYYGQTPRMSGPNDGFHVWNRWLGSDRYSTPDRISSSAVKDMNRFFGAWTQTTKKPFLNKNNRNTHCVQLLEDNLPDPYFIVIRRETISVVRSLIRARQLIQGDKSYRWGLNSQDAHSHCDPLGYVDDVCEQVARIEKRLDSQLRHIDSSRVVRCRYEDMCESPSTLLDAVHHAIPGLHLHEALIANELRPFTKAASRRLSDAEESRMAERIGGDTARTDAKRRDIP